MADNGSTVFVRPGTTVILRLGGNLEWRVRSTDPTVLPQVAGAFAPGVQAAYQAQFPGTAVIRARGEPFCPPGEPCLPFIQPFQVRVIVR